MIAQPRRWNGSANFANAIAADAKMRLPRLGALRVRDAKMRLSRLRHRPEKSRQRNLIEFTFMMACENSVLSGRFDNYVIRVSSMKVSERNYG